MKGNNATLTNQQRLIAIVAVLLLSFLTLYLTLNFSVMPLFIVGVPALFSYWLWYRCYLRNPTEPSRLLPVFLLTCGGFALHAIEEYLGHYGPAVGRLFGFAWTDQAFVIIVFCLLGALSFVGIGLQRRMPIAGLVAIVFMATRLAEIMLFIFPLLAPSIQPDIAASISDFVGSTWVQNMPNYYIGITHWYYWPGMYTVILPVVPAVIGLLRIWHTRDKN